MKKCPECGSKNVKVLDYRGTSVMLCKECGYDERDELDITPNSRETQREKRKFSPYRSRS